MQQVVTKFSVRSGGSGEANRGMVSRRTSRLLTMTGVCFAFGALAAYQLQAMQTLRLQRETASALAIRNTELAKQQTAQARAQTAAEEKRRAEEEKKRTASEAQVRSLTAKLSATGSLSAAQTRKLNAQIKSLNTQKEEALALAGLTPMRGPGVRLTISDSPVAAQFPDPSGFGPGMVHDYDLQQIVNELRAAKAEGIAIRGAGGPLTRVTGYTPIRCVGPVIQVNYEPVAAPFVIEAVGDPGTLESTLDLPGGVVDRLRAPGQGLPALPVKIERIASVSLPAAENAPKLRVSRVP